MRHQLLESRVVHCDETRAQVMKEPDREPTSQSWMWVQAGEPPNQLVILFDLRWKGHRFVDHARPACEHDALTPIEYRESLGLAA
jgi:hypothetical protein